MRGIVTKYWGSKSGVFNYLGEKCMDSKIIIVFNAIKRNIQVDLEVPLDISARELMIGLNQAYGLDVDTTDIKQCYLKAENPIALLRGNKLLREYGLRNGSIINFTE